MDKETIVTIVLAIFASSGFWTFVKTVYENTKKKQSAENRLLLGEVEKLPIK